MCRDLRFIGKVRLLYHRIITDPMYARGLKNIDRFIAPSVYMKDIAERDGFTSIVIPNGTTLFSESPKDVKDCTRTLAFGGRLEKGKGVDVLLRAFARTLAVFPDARLIVAGDGRERESLVSLAADLGVSQKVEFLGHVDRAALEGVYQRADVAVMPSVWTEAFGLAGIEALSVGRPVIASSVGGIPEWLIDGETGYLVTPGDPDALYAAIKKIFSDPERLVQMMKTSRSRAEEFGIDVHAKKIAALYADLLRKKRKIV
jgi:glycogen(starch) synthase